MARRLARLLTLAAVVLMVAGCIRTQYVKRRQLTGTCTGACNHYVTCKASDDLVLFQSCMSECSQVFSDPVSLQAFESLYCADAISYIEGPSGREPGQPVDGSLAPEDRAEL